MKAGIVTSPASTANATWRSRCARAFGREPRMIWHKETDLPDVDLVVIPGGFSFGDYLRCGAMAAHSPMMRAVHEHAARGGYVLGVCNGFQILTEAGLLPGALLRNASLRFLSMDCHLRVERNDTVFTSRYQTRRGVPRRRWRMATATISPMTPRSTGWRARTWSPSAMRPIGEITPEANRNGSARAIAGIFSPQSARARPDAAPGGPGRPADGRHRRQAAVRRPGRRMTASQRRSRANPSA